MTDQASPAKKPAQAGGPGDQQQDAETVVVRVERRVREAMMGKTITRSPQISQRTWKRRVRGRATWSRSPSAGRSREPSRGASRGLCEVKAV